MEIEELLRENTYPGRGIIVGLSHKEGQSLHTSSWDEVRRAKTACLLLTTRLSR